ncbi:MAG: helix-turn-helix transcriptional regulator [bacterium]|nr:helix-turn-helix transcriptional regulator [bacterium]
MSKAGEYDLQGIGKRLKEIRKTLNLKQAAFARSLNTTVTTLSDTETGKKKPGFEVMFLLSRDFKVRLEYLLHGEGEMFGEKAEAGGITIEDGIFGHYTGAVKEMLWYMQHSLLARSAILTRVKEYLYKNEELLNKDIEKIKEKLKQ